MRAARRHARRQRAQAEGPARPAATFPYTYLEITDSYKIRVTRVKSGATALRRLAPPRRSPPASRAPAAARPLQPLLQEADETRRHEAGIAPGLIDWIAEPVMRRAL